MNARARRWTRVEALAIVLIFDAAVVFVAAIHNDRAPLPPTQAAPAPSVTSPAVTPPPSPARHSTEGKPVHIEQRAGATVVPPPTAAPPKTSPRPTSSPTPTPPSYSGTWTVCGPTADGDLFRSEERRVGKECRARWRTDHQQEKSEHASVQNAEAS